VVLFLRKIFHPRNGYAESFVVPGTKVRIAGAGIAGLTSAITLARAKQPVEVFETKVRVGSTAGPHTEGVRNYLGRDGLEDLARFGVTVEPFSVAMQVIRRSPHLVNTTRGPSFYLVSRGGGPKTLERQLLEQATAAGAKVRFKHSVSPAEVDIVATGAPRDRVNIVAAGYRFSRQGSHLPDDVVYSLWDNEVAPRGYLCVLPGPMWHSVYSCAWGSIEYGSLLRMVDRALQLPWVKDLVGSAKLLGRICGKGYYAEDPLAHLSSSKPLFVGEAAGLQDPVGGFGIRYSIASGHLAARSLVDGTDYASAVRKEFGEDLSEAARGRQWLDHATNEDFDNMVRKLGPEGQVVDYATWRKVRFI
jgi:flavin-dependent dehydrogenase